MLRPGRFTRVAGRSNFSDCKQLGGMGLVLGGSRRFKRTQLDAVATAALYSDTVLIPDPVLPWLLETEREEEKFPAVWVGSPSGDNFLRAGLSDSVALPQPRRLSWLL